MGLLLAILLGFEASQSTSVLTVMGDWRDMTLPIVCIALLVLAGYSGACGRRRWTPWPRTTSRWRGPRACPSGSCCCVTWSVMPACR
ncbi:MAG TPA: hypothetical protein VFW50_34765 [Streptosporangiaceae bacterium]|nr:hypothetical protein [Streptosporangiaceae bacterium]